VIGLAEPSSAGTLTGKGLIYFSKYLPKRNPRFSIGQESVKYDVGPLCYSEFQLLHIYFCVSMFISVVLLCPVLVDLWDIPAVATGTFLP
jgi:hypothetical protein